MKRIAIFASGNGSNAENIITHFRKNNRDAEVALVVCNKPEAGVIERAGRLGTDTIVMTRADINDPEKMLAVMDEYKIDLIALAGFLLMVPAFLIERYKGKILNIHPSLLPKYGGKGMYGKHIHEAVVAAKEKETGITIHLVSEECDGGDIIFQTSVPVEPDDTAADVEAKIHALEKEHYPNIIGEIILGTR